MKTDVLYPDFVARFYDVIYAKIRTSVDHDYYLRKMAESKGPVLEVGVGTGRLFMDALRSGADIYGLDINVSMLEQLKRRIPSNEAHRVIHADVRDFSIGKSFDLIVAPFRVFSHLIETEEQLSALGRIKTYLKDDGLFIWDLFDPDPVLCSKGLEPTVDFDGYWKEGKKLQRITSVIANPSRQINHASMRYVWDDDDGTHDKTWVFSMRYFFRYELEHLIQLSGLKLINLFGDFEQNEVSDVSKEFVIVCSK
jgi:ubiquinone/menaquinone biosynthesis C-methylase UbiE